MLRPYFVGSFPRADVPLDPPLPELALIGRSNVGKSSLLNALVGQRIARVSQTPGKTRGVNVYEIQLGRRERGEVRDGAHRPPGVDRRGPLPSPLSLCLLDIRRTPSADDSAMQDLLAARQTRVLAALTKGDKLPRGERRPRERTLAATLRLAEDQAVVTSARTGEGVAELREAIEALVRETVS